MQIAKRLVPRPRATLPLGFVQTSYVFSCFNQDRELDRVDFGALSERLRQNSLQVELTEQWIARCLTKLGAGGVCAEI